MERIMKQVFSSLRERTCVSYAKIATIGGFSDLDIIIIKATSPDDLPLSEKYIAELLKIFSISPSSIRAFSFSFIRRFGKTQSWKVALKCLILLHRLLESFPDDNPFRNELLCCRENGLLSLYPCHFSDCSSSYSEDYTSFIRSYAWLLDEILTSVFIGIENNQELDRIEEVERMVRVLTQLQSLIDRVINCRPTEAAARSYLVKSTMKYVIRDSFICYTTFRNELVVVLDNLIELPYKSCVAAFEVYKKAALQADQLYGFYNWCKCMQFCGSYEYPFVDRIPKIQIEALEAFLNGMWKFMSPVDESTLESPLSCIEDDPDKILVDIVSTNRKGQSDTQNFSYMVDVEKGRTHFGDHSAHDCRKGPPDSQISCYVLDVEKDRTQFGNCSTDDCREGLSDTQNSCYMRDLDKDQIHFGNYFTDDWTKFDELESNKGVENDKEMDPLIQFEVDNVGWEALLETSIKSSCIVSENNLYCHPREYGYDYEYGNNAVNGWLGEAKDWQMQVYKPTIHHCLNPFQQPCNTPIHNGSFSSNPTYPWGL